jgi:uncharacterized protein YdhG (YjbR/CyaY superfamily)
MADAKTIDEYIKRFSPEVQKRLKELRDFIKSEVPEATEKISYGMPTFYLNGNLFYFAAFKDHYGFYPASTKMDKLEKELAPYRTGKGTLSFALDKPFPWKIISKVIKFRVSENLKKPTRSKPKAAQR